jgi:hypothetical protein
MDEERGRWVMMELDRVTKVAWSLLLALGIWLMGPLAIVPGDMAALVSPRVAAQPSIPEPALLPPTGNCSRDNIYYGAVPPGGEQSRVLVFVHGYAGLATDWWTTATSAGWNDMYVQSYLAGYRTAFVNVNVEAGVEKNDCLITEREPSYDMLRNGLVLKDQIAAITDYYKVPTVDIIAHSKGGIDAQTAIAWFGSWRNVRNLFTIGTPHQGSLLADLVWSPEGKDLRGMIGKPDIATLSMRTLVMQIYRLLTDQIQVDDHISYYQGAGTFWNTPHTFYPYTGKWLQERPAGGDNDGVVTVASTALPYGQPLFLEPWNHVELTLGRNAFPFIHEVLLNDVTPPTDLTLQGPNAGTIGREYEFILAMPLTVTRPLTYTWQATEQGDVEVRTDAIFNAKKYIWNMPGTKDITVVIANAEAAATVTHQIEINPVVAPTGLTLTGVVEGDVAVAYNFNAVLPFTITAPITYTWHATDQVGLTKTSGTTDSITFRWSTPGLKTLTVNATNGLGTVSASHTVRIGEFIDPTEHPNNYYIPQVRSNNDGPIAQAETSAAILQNMSEAQREALNESNYILRSGQLDQTGIEQFPIEMGATNASFTLLTSNPAMQAELISPDGKIYPLTEVPVDPGTLFPTVALLEQRVESPLPGQWQVQLHAPSSAGYLLMVTLDSKLEVYLAGMENLVADPGAQLAVSALSQAENAVSQVEQITATLSSWMSDRSESELAGSDAALQFTVPEEPGPYETRVKVTGQVDGSAFERNFIQSLLVLPDEDTISLSFLKGLLDQWICQEADCPNLPRSGLSQFAVVAFTALLLIANSATIEVNSVQATTFDAAVAETRALEPVVVKGLFVGATVEQVYVYRYVGAAWEAIPFQIDRVDTDGTYLAEQEGVLDENDEIVLMARDLGELAPVLISDEISIEGQWYQVEVSDPLSAGDTGYAYIVRSTAGLQRSDVDYVDFDAATVRVTTDNYAVGWAGDHSGLDHMSLFGSADILDRTKVRLTYRVGGGVPQTITEEGNALVPVVDAELIKDGPVRVIVRRGTVVTFAYQSLLRTLLRVDLSSIPLLTIDGVRSSTDLANNVTGTYYDENNAAGVSVDGVVDAVEETPFDQAWREVALDSGTMLQVTNLSGLGGFRRHYYKDDATVDNLDTGDGQSFGDSGFLVINPTGKVFVLDSLLYFLPGKQENRGSEFHELYQNALGVEFTIQGEVDESDIFLPALQKQS